MFLTLLCAGCLCGQPAPTALAREAPAAEALSGQVRSLLRQLNDDALAQRDAAEKQLLNLGPSALDHLPANDDGLPAEVKERLKRVRNKLQTALVEAATTATRVTLQGEMTLAQALEQLQKQTGNRFESLEGLETPVRPKFDKTPFWPALDALLDEAGLNINEHGGPHNALALVGRPDDQRPRAAAACYEGVFRFEATRLAAQRDLRHPATRGLDLSLLIGWEPRLTPISLELPLSAIRAVDDQGQPLPVAQPQGQLDTLCQTDIPVVELDIPFELPPRKIEKIASLKGEARALLPGRVETFEFSSLAAKNVEQRKANVTVLFDGARKNNDAWEVLLRVRYDDPEGAFESHRGWIYRNEAYLVDKQGQRVDGSDFGGSSRAENEIGLAYVFFLEKELKEYTFVYKSPGAVVKKTAVFELKDIPLP